ncbi:hypothetical protein SLOPH_2570, partial [Spraguea lophii 42_110]
SDILSQLSLCYYKKNTIPFKVHEQCKFLLEIIKQEGWGNRDEEISFTHYNYYDVIQYKKKYKYNTNEMKESKKDDMEDKYNDELVSHAFIRKQVYYDVQHQEYNLSYLFKFIPRCLTNSLFNENIIIKKNIIEIYTLIIPEKYRGLGIAKPFLMDIVNMYKNQNIDYIALHINPADKSMSKSFVFYSSMGFNKIGYVKYGPFCYKDRVKDIENMEDVVSFVRRVCNIQCKECLEKENRNLEKENIDKTKENIKKTKEIRCAKCTYKEKPGEVKGRYLAMFCKMDEFGYKNIYDREEMKMLGEQLKMHLLELRE